MNERTKGTNEETNGSCVTEKAGRREEKESLSSNSQRKSLRTYNYYYIKERRVLRTHNCIFILFFTNRRPGQDVLLIFLFRFLNARTVRNPAARVIWFFNRSVGVADDIGARGPIGIAPRSPKRRIVIILACLIPSPRRSS